MNNVIEYTSEEKDKTSEKKNRNGEHILVSLTYIGKNTKKDNGVGLTRTLEKWRRDNEKSDITSALVINDSYLIQNIEGSRPVINEVLAKLINEYSHMTPHIIDIEEVDTRKWDDFLIKYLTSSAQDEEYTLKNFSAGADFNPYLMKKTQIISFMNAIFEEK
ncbi:BLUF domain-containing protein [Psychrobacter glacincola]|uniref:BLUF domain-containing protein n=1 Tax=Psychrobacter glacincola TaxID=56810 RepID=UPI003BB73CE7